MYGNMTGLHGYTYTTDAITGSSKMLVEVSTNYGVFDYGSIFLGVLIGLCIAAGIAGIVVTVVKTGRK